MPPPVSGSSQGADSERARATFESLPSRWTAEGEFGPPQQETYHPVLLCEKVAAVPPRLGVVETLGDGCVVNLPCQVPLWVEDSSDPMLAHVQTTSPPAQKCFPLPLMRMTLARSLASKRCADVTTDRASYVHRAVRRGEVLVRLGTDSRRRRDEVAGRQTDLELGLDQVDHLIVERVERLGAVESDSPESMNGFERDDGLPNISVRRTTGDEGQRSGSVPLGRVK